MTAKALAPQGTLFPMEDVRLLDSYRAHAQGWARKVGTICLSSNNAYGSALLGVMAQDAQRVDILVPYIEFDFYAPHALNLLRRRDTRLNVVFHDTAFHSRLPVVPEFQPYIQNGRARFFEYGPSLPARAMAAFHGNDKCHIRLWNSDMGGFMGLFGEDPVNNVVLTYFARVKSLAQSVSNSGIMQP